MPGTFKNLLHVLKRFKLATVTNLSGLCLAFFLFILICIHVNHEYGFNSSITNKERIFQLEMQRDNGIWEASIARPQIERFITVSPNIEAAGITNNLVYTSFRFGVSANSGPDAVSYIEKLDRITSGYTNVFGFKMTAGSADCLKQPNGMLIPESIAKKLFGKESPIGKQIYLSELNGIDNFSAFGQKIEPIYMVGGVYQDFPENTRVKNALYIPIMEKEMMDNWYTGGYFCYILMSSGDDASFITEQYMSENRESMKNFKIEDLRLRSLPELYFGNPARSDAAPKGNRLRTNMLLFIAILIIGIALVNYVNLSMALAPIRTKSITTQKVLGGSSAQLRKHLVLESLGISTFSFLLALTFVLLAKNSPLITNMLGHPVNLAANRIILVWTFILATGTGVLAGLYPAFYITSFPPAAALSGSFSLSNRAKNTQKLLIGFQFVISITLITGSLFVFLQNKYIGNVNLGYDKEKILEVKLSIGTALSKSELLRSRLREHPDINDIAFNEYKFVSDESRPFIGYNYSGQHSYMNWFGVSPNFPELMDFKIIAGRSFLDSDEAPGNPEAACIINETAAREIVSRFTPDEISDISSLIGTSFIDKNVPVQIVGIFRDIHYESLYKEIQSQGFWVSAKNHYRRTTPEIYTYIKITGGNPQASIEHIRSVMNDLNPGYPADIRFFDNVLDDLYSKSHRQGLLVTILCLLAVILSLVGVFGLVIFETQGREKEIAIRKVFGATVRQILWMFNSSFFRVAFVSYIISAPIAYYGVSIWLQSFAYKTPLYIWVFFLALAVIVFLTISTVTFQSYHAATSNPARKLYR